MDVALDGYGSCRLLRLVAGPDAGRTIRVTREPLVLGRVAGAGRIVDPLLEAHHLLVRSDGRRIAVTQLAGRLPVRVDGEVLDATAELGPGAEIHLGATRVVVADVPPCRPVTAGAIVLGVGLGAPTGAGRLTDVTLDLDEVRRLLVTGPSADGMIRAVLAQAGGRRTTVTSRTSALGHPPGVGVVLVPHDDLEAGWPGAELPADAAIVAVGTTWEAVLLRPSPDGGATITRFHAAGRPRRSGADRSFVAQQVARARAELGGHVTGVPQAARGE